MDDVDDPDIDGDIDREGDAELDTDSDDDVLSRALKDELPVADGLDVVVTSVEGDTESDAEPVLVSDPDDEPESE